MPEKQQNLYGEWDYAVNVLEVERTYVLEEITKKGNTIAKAQAAIEELYERKQNIETVLQTLIGKAKSEGKYLETQLTEEEAEAAMTDEGEDTEEADQDAPESEDEEEEAAMEGETSEDEEEGSVHLFRGKAAPAPAGECFRDEDGHIQPPKKDPFSK